MKTRQLKFADKEIREIIQKRGEIIKKGRKVNAERDKLDKRLKELDIELNKLGLKAQKFEDKLRPWVNEVVMPQLEDTEDISVINSNGDMVTVDIYDRVDEFKEMLLKAKAEQNEKIKATQKIDGKMNQ